jgi:hypothetical protein
MVTMSASAATSSLSKSARAELRRYRPQQAQEFRKNLSRARQGACCNLVVSGKAPTLAKDYIRTWDTTAR